MPAPTSPTTTAAPATTVATAPATSTTAATPEVVAYQLAGGTVVISVAPGRVALVSASPRAGYAMEIDANGPEEVRVEFEGEIDSEFRARWSGGTRRCTSAISTVSPGADRGSPPA